MKTRKINLDDWDVQPIIGAIVEDRDGLKALLRAVSDTDWKPEFAERLEIVYRTRLRHLLAPRIDVAHMSDFARHLHAVSTVVDRHNPDFASRLGCYEAIVSDAVEELEGDLVGTVLNKDHVRTALSFLAEHPGPVSASDLRKHLKIQLANTSRVLGLMQSAGLVTRARQGKEVLVASTVLGKERTPPKIEPPLPSLVPPPALPNIHKHKANGVLTLNALSTDIFDCDALAYADRLGLGEKFGICFNISPISNVNYIDQVAAHLSEPWSSDRFEVNAAVLPRQALQREKAALGNSVDVFVLSTFVGHALIAEREFCESVKRAANRIRGNRDFLLAKLLALQSHFTHEPSGTFHFAAYDEPANRFAQMVQKAFKFEGLLHQVSTNGALADPHTDKGKRYIGVTTGTARAIAASKKLEPLLTFQECEQASHLLDTDGDGDLDAKFRLALFRDFLDALAPGHTVVHSALHLNLSSELLFTKRRKSEEQAIALQALYRCYAMAADLAENIRSRPANFATFLCERRHEFRGKGKVNSDLYTKIEPPDVATALTNSYRFTRAADYFDATKEDQYYWSVLEAADQPNTPRSFAHSVFTNLCMEIYRGVTVSRDKGEHPGELLRDTLAYRAGQVAATQARRTDREPTYIAPLKPLRFDPAVLEAPRVRAKVEAKAESPKTQSSKRKRRVATTE